MRMGQKHPKATPNVKSESETALVEYKPRPLGVKEEKFCLQFVITDDRHLSYERAGFLATARNVQSAAISRLMKMPKVKARIEELRTELLLAQGVTKERVTANLAEIGFDKRTAKADRNTALRTLAQTLGMLSETVNYNDVGQQRELDAREAEECRQIALIRLKMQISGQSAEQPLLAEVGGSISKANNTEAALLENRSNGEGERTTAEGLQGREEGSQERNGQCNGQCNACNGDRNGSNERNAPDSNNQAGSTGGGSVGSQAAVIQSDDGGVCAASPSVVGKQPVNSVQTADQQGAQWAGAEVILGRNETAEGPQATPVNPPMGGVDDAMVLA